MLVPHNRESPTWSPREIPVSGLAECRGKDEGDALEMIDLYHGTTEAAATRIVSAGFATLPPLRSVLEDFCVSYEVSVDAVIDQLAQMNRFLVVQTERSEGVWFATTRTAGLRWADRAPEWRWEALWAVWMLRHGQSKLESTPDYSCCLDPAASAWHLAQRWQDLPAVIRVEVEPNALADRDRSLVGSSSWESTPEVRIRFADLPTKTFDIEIGEHRVEFTDACGFLGLSIEEFVDLVRAGEVPRPDPPRDVGEYASWSASSFVAWSRFDPFELSEV